MKIAVAYKTIILGLVLCVGNYLHAVFDQCSKKVKYTNQMGWFECSTIMAALSVPGFSHAFHFLL